MFCAPAVPAAASSRAAAERRIPAVRLFMATFCTQPVSSAPPSRNGRCCLGARLGGWAGGSGKRLPGGRSKPPQDRKRDGSGRSGSVRVDLGGSGDITKNITQRLPTYKPV